MNFDIKKNNNNIPLIWKTISSRNKVANQLMYFTADDPALTITSQYMYVQEELENVNEAMCLSCNQKYSKISFE